MFFNAQAKLSYNYMLNIYKYISNNRAENLCINAAKTLEPRQEISAQFFFFGTSHNSNPNDDIDPEGNYFLMSSYVELMLKKISNCFFTINCPIRKRNEIMLKLGETREQLHRYLQVKQIKIKRTIVMKTLKSAVTTY